MTIDTAKVVPLTCHGHSRPVVHLNFSAIGDDEQYYLISACKDNNPMLRDGITGDWIGTFIGHKGAVWQARLSSDATLAVTGSADFTAKIWDTHTGEALHTLQHSHIVRAVAFPSQPRPTSVATGGFEKKLRIWDLSQATSVTSPASPNSPASNSAGATTGATNDDSGSSAPSYEVGANVHGGTIKSIVWGPDPNMLVSAADDKKIRWWDLRSRAVVEEFELDGEVGSCEINAAGGAPSMNPASVLNEITNGGGGDGHLGNGTSNGNGAAAERGPILSVAAGKKVYFFDATAPNRLMQTSTMPYEVISVALSPDRTRFVTGASGDTWVRVHDYEYGQELELSKGHHGPIWSISFSPDGKLYATGSEDGTIKLWKFTTTPYGLWR